MSRLSVAQARALAARVVELTDADAAEVLVHTTENALTRFAKSRIHQNVAETSTSVSVRAVIGQRQGVASTTRVDDEGLAACCSAAAEAAKIAPEDPAFPGLPAAEPVAHAQRASTHTQAFGPDARAKAAAAIISPSAARGLDAAGTVEVTDSVIAIASTRAIDAAQETTEFSASVLSMGMSGGTGWAAVTALSPDGFDASSLGEEAAALAERSSDPVDFEPGSYPVVLSYEAVADLLTFLAYTGFSAKTVEEGSSFLAGRLGEKLLHEAVTVVDDAHAPHAIGLTFDYEGVPKQRTTLIEHGVAIGPVTDSYWAARTGRANTGHALPAPNAFGPYPLNMEMAGGSATLDELIGAVKRGVYVTRFHYVNVEDPVTVLLTGMTRDGTFLIENGSLTQPVKNLRFTQSAVTALSSVGGATAERRLAGERGSASMVPALLLDSFSFTGQTG